ncbi:MAG TPA: hypothetical protein VNL16_08980 [Chloroflexota bacterium]|nr:hypothetical protein [Chloroflexota bacterium]
MSERVPGPVDAQPSEDLEALFHLPRPTAWPAVMAAGICMFMAGIITNLAFSVAGIIIFAIALVGWIREFRHV